MSAVAAGTAPARRSKLKFGPLWLAVPGLAFLTAVSSLALLKRGWFRLASRFLLAGGTTCVTLSFLLEGARSQAAGNFVIVIVMAALLVGWRGVLVVGLPSAAASSPYERVSP